MISFGILGTKMFCQFHIFHLYSVSLSLPPSFLSPSCTPPSQFQLNLAKSQAPSSLPLAQTTTDSGVTDIDDALTNLQVGEGILPSAPPISQSSIALCTTYTTATKLLLACVLLHSLSPAESTRPD